MNDQQRVEVATSDKQQIAELVRFCKGWHKFAPFVGACLLEALHDEQNATQLRSRIAAELEEDGATTQAIQIGADDTIKVDAYYA